MIVFLVELISKGEVLRLLAVNYIFIPIRALKTILSKPLQNVYLRR